MTEQLLIVNLEKSITGERHRSMHLTQNEAIWTLRYIFSKILKIPPEALCRFFDSKGSFLQEYGLYRYYRMIKFPFRGPKDRYYYLLSKMFADIYPPSKNPTPLDKYIETLSPSARPSDDFWLAYHDFHAMQSIVQWMCQVIFPHATPEEIMEFTIKEQDHFLQIVTTLKLWNFYEENYAHPIDMVFFSYPDTVQKKYFRTYLKLRLPLCDATEKYLLIQAGQVFQRSLL